MCHIVITLKCLIQIHWAIYQDYFIVYMLICLSLCRYMHVSSGAHGSQKNPLELQFRVIMGLSNMSAGD